MMNDRIYDIKHQKLATWLIPAPLRKVRLISWVMFLIKPIEFLYEIFLLYRKDTLYWLGFNSQVCYLEKMLNDMFDFVPRRIFIGQGKHYNELYLYKEEMCTPAYLYTALENKAVLFLYTDAEVEAVAADYVVNIPMQLDYNKARMDVLLQTHHLPDKTYTVKYF